MMHGRKPRRIRAWQGRKRKGGLTRRVRTIGERLRVLSGTKILAEKAKKDHANEKTEDEEDLVIGVVHKSSNASGEDEVGDGTSDELEEGGTGQEDGQHIDDSNLPINVAQWSFRAPPHLHVPILCMGSPQGGWLSCEGGLISRYRPTN
jgi:hypothetical protein